MQKSLRVAVVLVALGLAFGSVMVGLAQTAGGYKKIATDDKEAVAAADFAVGAQSEKQNATIKLISIEHAERQVVAGMNFRLCLQVELEANDGSAAQSARVVVHRNLKGVYSLTSWEDGGCGGDH